MRRDDIRMTRLRPRNQGGATLIEVLVAVLILSFGLLSLGGVLSYAVQMPKLSAYRAAAMRVGSAHIDRMRANTSGFTSDAYTQGSSYAQPPSGTTPCAYPACTAASLATLDKEATQKLAAGYLPNGGIQVACNGGCATMEGDLWVLWAEPTTFGSFSTSASDECPTGAAAGARCVHIRFKL